MANFTLKTPDGTDTYNGASDSYEIGDGVLKIYALSGDKPVLIMMSLQRLIRLEDWEVPTEPLIATG
jgi:hypothetical protein